MATFCLLHGKWHDPSCWEPLAPELEALGHRCVAPGVPFHDPAATYEERARPAIEALRGAEPPVAVVGHSLAAGVAPLVAAGADAAALVYLCPAPTGPFDGVDAGTPAIRKGFPFPPDREDGTSVWEPDAAVAVIYPRLAEETARALAARLRPGSSAPDPFPSGALPPARAALVLAEHDEFFEPEWSRRVARLALENEAIELATGHFPMIEAPGELARVLDGCAGAPGSDLEIVRAGYAAWNRGDLDGWLAFADPEVLLDLPGLFPDFEPEYRGRDGLTRFWNQLRDPWEEFRIEVHALEAVASGEVVATITFRARGAGSGADVVMNYGHGLRLRGGRAVEMYARATPEEAREALRDSRPAA